MKKKIQISEFFFLVYGVCHTRSADHPGCSRRPNISSTHIHRVAVRIKHKTLTFAYATVNRPCIPPRHYLTIRINSNASLCDTELFRDPCTETAGSSILFPCFKGRRISHSTGYPRSSCFALCQVNTDLFLALTTEILHYALLTLDFLLSLCTICLFVCMSNVKVVDNPQGYFVYIIHQSYRHSASKTLNAFPQMTMLDNSTSSI